MLINTVLGSDTSGVADERRAGTAGMTRWAIIVLALALVAGPAAAQSGRPRLRPEQIKAAPVVPARLPDGHPNWTGFWVPPGGLLDTYRGPSGIEGAPPNVNVPVVRKDIPAMKSPYKEEYEATIKKALAGTVPDPVAACFPPGMPAMMGAVYGLEILQTPNIIAITSEWQAENRRIWMDLKKHPSGDDLDPSYAGNSIGHWEGDTLVVDTVGLRKDVSLDARYLPHSDKTRLIERFSQAAPGVLVDNMTVEDPDVFVTPWKYRLVYVHKPDFRLQEYSCLDNNRNVDAEGRTAFK